MTTGERIHQIRKEKDMTLEQLAQAAGITRSTVAKYEKDIIRNIPQENIEAMARALGVSPSQLTGWVDGSEIVVNLSKARPMTGYLPIYGIIAAGEPQFADENIIDYVLTDVKRPENYFGLKVKGDSMINAGITDGAYVIFEKSSDAADNDIVACRVNGDEATLKRFRRHADSVLLMPENPKYSPIIVSASEFENGYAQVIGIAREIRFKI